MVWPMVQNVFNSTMMARENVLDLTYPQQLTFNGKMATYLLNELNLANQIGNCTMAFLILYVFRNKYGLQLNSFLVSICHEICSNGLIIYIT